MSRATCQLVAERDSTTRSGNSPLSKATNVAADLRPNEDVEYYGNIESDMKMEGDEWDDLVFRNLYETIELRSHYESIKGTP